MFKNKVNTDISGYRMLNFVQSLRISDLFFCVEFDQIMSITFTLLVLLVPLLVVLTNATENEHRLMFFFSTDCLSQHTIHNHDYYMPQTTNKLKTLQHQTINSIIHDHNHCISHTRNNNKIHHFIFPQLKTGVSFADVNLQKCLININNQANILQIHRKSFQNQLISNTSLINYTEHCIKNVTYEPFFKLARNENLDSFDTSYKPQTTNNYSCIVENYNYSYNYNSQNDTIYISKWDKSYPNYFTHWGLDQTDSHVIDNKYTYPDISHDNGVDLYIVDTGIRSTHVEFYPNQVFHEMGNGPASYKPLNMYLNHGTHVAAIAGGKTVGYSRNLKIYDYKVCDYLFLIRNDSMFNSKKNTNVATCFYHDVLIALKKIVEKLMNSNKNDNGRRRAVISFAMGTPKTFFDSYWEYYLDLIVEYGGIVIASAGNDNDQACHYTPAAYDKVITVGAAQQDFNVCTIFCTLLLLS